MYSSDEISDMTFRRRPSVNLSDHSGDLLLYNLLLAVDGKRSVAMIAKEDVYELDDLTSRINQLVEKQLIEPVGGAGAAVPPAWIDDLTAELSGIIGPMANVVIGECAAKLGHQPRNIPSAKAHSLLEALSVFIQPASKAEAFKSRMAARISGRV